MIFFEYLTKKIYNQLIIRRNSMKNNLVGAGIEPLFELFSLVSVFSDTKEKASGESPVLFSNSSHHTKHINKYTFGQPFKG